MKVRHSHHYFGHWNRALQRGGAGLFSLMFLVTQTWGATATEGRFWDERRKAAQSHRSEGSGTQYARAPMETSLSSLEGTHILSSAVQPLSKNSPGSLYAEITRPRRSPDEKTPLIIHVQDIHDVEEAQINISEFIKDLARTDGVVEVGLEGAAGDFKLDAWRNYVAPELVQSGADELLSQGLIGGPEHAGLTSPIPLRLFGAEDLSLYQANLAVAKEALSRRAALGAALAPLKQALETAEKTYWSEALRAHRRRALERAAGRLPLGDYAASLMSQPGVQSLAVPNVRLLLESFHREKSMDFDQVARERNALIEEMTARLSPAEIQNLISLAERLRAGRVNHSAFFAALDKVAQRHGLVLSRYPALQKYRVYTAVAEQIERDALLTELETLDRTIGRSLATTEAARRTLACEEGVLELEKLIQLSLTTDEWGTYRTHRTKIFELPSTLAALGAPALPALDPADVKIFERFFELAEERNNALASRVYDRLSATGARAVVLVAGGFHSTGLEKAIRDKKMDVMVYTPRLSVAPEGNPGLAALARGPLPLEKIFAGEPIALVNERVLSPIPNSNVAPQRAAEGTWLSLITLPLAKGHYSLSEANQRMGTFVRSLAVTTKAWVQKLRGSQFLFSFTDQKGKTNRVTSSMEGNSSQGVSMEVPDGDRTVAISLSPDRGRLSTLGALTGDLSERWSVFSRSALTAWKESPLGRAPAWAYAVVAIGVVFFGPVESLMAVAMVPLITTDSSVAEVRDNPDPVDDAETGHARLKALFKETTDPSQTWIINGDFDMLGAKNGLLGKMTMGDLGEGESSPWVMFADKSLFLEMRKTVVEAIHGQGGRVHRGEGGDELVLEFQGAYADIKKKLDAVVAAVDVHFRNRYAFFAIHKPHLNEEEKAALRQWVSSGVLVHYGEGFRLVMERSEGTTQEQLLRTLQEKLSPDTFVSPLMFETKDRGPFTLSLGAVNARDIMGLLAKKTGSTPGKWFNGSGWTDDEGIAMAEVMLWGARFAEDALKAAKNAGRNRAVVLNSVQAIENVLPENRVTEQRINSLTGQSAAEAAGTKTEFDPLVGWRHMGSFKQKLRKVNLEKTPILHFVWVGSYMEDRRIKRRAFNELQGLPGADHEMGNMVIREVFNYLKILFRVRTIPDKLNGSRAPPDGAYRLAQNKDLELPSEEEAKNIFSRLGNLLPKTPAPMGPTIFTATLNMTDLGDLPAEYKSPMFMTEMISKTVSYTVAKLEDAHRPDWKSALEKFVDVQILHSPTGDGTAPYWLVQATFNKEKFAALKEAFHAAERSISEEGYRELTGAPMPQYRRSDDAEGPEKVSQFQYRDMPQEGRGEDILKALRPVFQPLRLDGVLTEEGPLLKQSRERKGKAAAWADQFAGEHGVDRQNPPSLLEWKENKIDGYPHTEFEHVQKFIEARQLAGSSAVHAASVANLIAQGPREVGGVQAKLSWVNKMGEALTLLWAAEGDLSAGFRRARDLQAVLGAVALWAVEGQALDRELFDRLSQRLEDRLNQNLRYFARVEMADAHYQKVLNEGKDIYIDMTDWSKREKDLLPFLSRLGRLMADQENPQSRLIFVDRGEETKNFEAEVRPFLEKSGFVLNKNPSLVFVSRTGKGNDLYFHGPNVIMLDLTKALGGHQKSAEIVTHESARWVLGGTLLNEIPIFLLLAGGEMVLNRIDGVVRELENIKFVSIAA